MCFYLSEQNAAAKEGLAAHADKVTEELHAKDMERQLQMQGEVSQIAASVVGRLAEIARECERLVSSVSDEVAQLEVEVSDRANIGEVRELSEEVSRLKEGERSLENHILGVPEVTSNSGSWDRMVVELGTDLVFISNNAPIQWISHDSKAWRVVTISYSIVSLYIRSRGSRAVKRRKRGLVEGR